MAATHEVLDLATVTNPVAPDVRSLLRDVVLVGDRARATESLARAMGVEPERLVLTDGSPAAAEALAGVDIVDDTWCGLDDGRWTSTPPGGGPGWHTGSLEQLWSLDGMGLAWILAPSAGQAAELQARTTRPALVALSLVEPLLTLTDLPRWAAIVASLRDDLVVLLEAYGCSVRPSTGPFVLVDDAGALVEGLAAVGVHVAPVPGAGERLDARIAVPDGTGLLRLAGALHAVRPPLAPGALP